MHTHMCVLPLSRSHVPPGGQRVSCHRHLRLHVCAPTARVVCRGNATRCQVRVTTWPIARVPRILPNWMQPAAAPPSRQGGLMQVLGDGVFFAVCCCRRRRKLAAATCTNMQQLVVSPGVWAMARGEEDAFCTCSVKHTRQGGT